MVRPLSVIVLAAGKGTRMRSSRPKVLFDVCGKPALAHVVEVAAELGAARVAVVVGQDGREACEQVLAAHGAADRLLFAVQDPPRGTGHAVQEAVAALGAAAAEDDVLVLYGDGPLIRAETARALLARHRESGAAATLLTAVRADPTSYGRIVTDAAGRVLRIVEELDADAETRAIHEVNTGISVYRAPALARALARLEPKNRKGELYLTDAAALIRSDGTAGGAVERLALADPDEATAFNSIAELAEVRRLMRARIHRGHQEAGVDIEDPATAYIDAGVTIGSGTRILPCVVIAAGVRIGTDCVVGPFTQLRAGTVLEDGAEIGNFTEVKKSVIGRGSKAKHLTYLGDAKVGARTNIGCGTITANYDGKHKHETRIGGGAFIGSGTVLVAPAEVEDGGVTGAGAIVTRNSKVGAGEVWVGVPARPLRKGGAATRRGADRGEGGS